VNYSAVILAAGKGTRMRSEIPKVMHKAAGKTLIRHVIDAVLESGVKDIVVVVGHGRASVEQELAGEGFRFAVQEEQRGTGHALLQAEPYLEKSRNFLVLPGDTPLLQTNALRAILNHHKDTAAQATVLSCTLQDPTGYGRIVRSAQRRFEAVVEEKDASPEQREISEINSGIYVFMGASVLAALHELKTNNAQKEYYLPDVLDIINRKGQKVEVLRHPSEEDIYGVNDRVQLAYAEKILRRRKNYALMYSGVTITDPDLTFIDASVDVGRDTVVLPFTFLAGNTKIGENCRLGPGSFINDSIVGNDTSVEYSRVKEAQIGDECTIGPYSYLRPETIIGNQVKIGDFVELKKTVVGEKSKIPHLSYIGDAVIGKYANVGAGTITCNYDGKDKYVTIIEDHAFIGSNTNLIAPITIGKNAVTGAGSSLSHDVPPDSLAVERAQAKVKKKRE
jgi:bifunctional UDP-N-acetylglucosamine pyrophosphorylase/glucosamine-1-phosphate N-acetyltransferase